MIGNNVHHVVVMLLLVANTVLGTQTPGQSRIYNGDYVVPSQFPYFASIRMKNGDICGGTLLSETKILTAAHCLQIKDDDGNLKDLTPLLQEVLIGCITPIEPSGTSECQKRLISSVYIHPGWNGYISKNSKDIAILSLDEPVTTITPVKIAESAEPGQSAEVVGFGQSGLDTSGKILTYATQIIRHIQDFYLTTVPDTAGPCYGDSGGPLLTAQGLVGIVSYGTGSCDSLDDTDGYFYVPSVRKWINLYINSEDEYSPSSEMSPPPVFVPSAQVENGIYTLQVASGLCKKKYLAATIKQNCADNKLRLYSSSMVRIKKRNTYRYRSASLWKIVRKQSDQTMYLQSVPRDVCVDTFIQSTKSKTTMLGPINEGWKLEKVSPQSKYVYLLSSKSYEYISVGKNCKPSDKAKNRTRLKFLIRKYEK